VSSGVFGVTGNHSRRVIPPHPVGPDHRETAVDRASTAHLVLGLAAAGERRARGAMSASRAVASVAMRPAAGVWRSGLAAPVRERADGTVRSLENDGREIFARARGRAREAASPLLEELVAQLADERVVERAVAELIARGTLSRVAEQLVEAGVAGEVVDGRLVDDVTERVLASEEMRRVLAFVMGSPELRAALAQQSAGLATDMATGMRARTSVADARAERLVRSLLRGRRK